MPIVAPQVVLLVQTVYKLVIEDGMASITFFSSVIITPRVSTMSPYNYYEPFLRLNKYSSYDENARIYGRH